MEITYHESERLAQGTDSYVISDTNHYATAENAEERIMEYFHKNKGIDVAFCRSLFAYRAVYLKSGTDEQVYLIACNEGWDEMTNLPPLDPTCHKLWHTNIDSEPTEQEIAELIANSFKDNKVKLVVLSETKGKIIIALMRNGQDLITIAATGN